MKKIVSLCLLGSYIFTSDSENSIERLRLTAENLSKIPNCMHKKKPYDSQSVESMASHQGNAPYLHPQDKSIQRSIVATLDQKKDVMGQRQKVKENCCCCMQ